MNLNFARVLLNVSCSFVLSLSVHFHYLLRWARRSTWLAGRFPLPRRHPRRFPFPQMHFLFLTACLALRKAFPVHDHQELGKSSGLVLLFGVLNHGLHLLSRDLPPLSVLQVFRVHHRHDLYGSVLPVLGRQLCSMGQYLRVHQAAALHEPTPGTGRREGPMSILGLP
ncbi:hypothetical protein K438DRAFT_1980801 [Mycena galopus ATCC 62051]|nr:hypothetical protein K438DRAFT_1980801 [Mycena galopus ATCC 62051]